MFFGTSISTVTFIVSFLVSFGGLWPLYFIDGLIALGFFKMNFFSVESLAHLRKFIVIVE